MRRFPNLNEVVAMVVCSGRPSRNFCSSHRLHIQLKTGTTYWSTNSPSAVTTVILEFFQGVIKSGCGKAGLARRTGGAPGRLEAATQRPSALRPSRPMRNEWGERWREGRHVWPARVHGRVEIFNCPPLPSPLPHFMAERGPESAGRRFAHPGAVPARFTDPRAVSRKTEASLTHF
jgi:hypothetical protein